MPSGAKSPTTGQQLTHAEWVAEAVRLSLKNWSSRRIGEKLGLHHTTVHEALVKELASRRVSEEERTAYANMQRETIFRMLSKWRPKALNGDKDAALVVHKYLERWAKLDGTDAPSKQELSGYGGAPIQFICNGLTDEQLDRLASIDAGDAAGVEGRGESGAGETSEGGSEATNDR